ncbi:MAG TPA: hypothetical protein VJH63_01855 [Candidatus Paceibacterota bacterium]
MKKSKESPKPKCRRGKWSGFGFKPIVLKIDWAKREREKEAEAFRLCGDGRKNVSVYNGNYGFISIAPRFGADGARESMLA